MAEWVGSNIAITVSGGNLGTTVNVEAQFKMAKITGTVEAVEVTRGKNKKHKNFANGMHEYPAEVTLGIDDGDIYPDYLELDQEYIWTFYPNDNTAGQPMHQQKYMLEEVPLEIEVGRGERVYKIKLKQCEDPVINMFELGVVAS